MSSFEESSLAQSNSIPFLSTDWTHEPSLESFEEEIQPLESFFKDVTSKSPEPFEGDVPQLIEDYAKTLRSLEYPYTSPELQILKEEVQPSGFSSPFN